MVATGEDLETNNLEENTSEEFENNNEDDDDQTNDIDENPGDDGDEDDEEEDDEDEEDPEDYQDALREKCQELSRCITFKQEFDNCESRVNSRQKTEENCAQELLDFVGCVDKCVSKSLFSHLK